MAIYCAAVAAAFDKVDSSRLISKLCSLRAPDNLALVLQSWLQSRIARVTVAGYTSRDITSNMAIQGTALEQNFVPEGGPGTKVMIFHEFLLVFWAKALERKFCSRGRLWNKILFQGAALEQNFVPEGGPGSKMLIFFRLFR